MSQELHAIDEHRDLWPRTPVNLPESTAVIVSFREATKVKQQQEALCDTLLCLMAHIRD